VLASAEGQRQLQNRIDWTGLRMEELASLEPLQQVSANIHEIDLSGCKNLKHLPIESIMELLSLKRLIIHDCPALLFPPREIASRDGAAVVLFLRHRCVLRHSICYHTVWEQAWPMYIQAQVSVT
jgi:hypothetical protein